MQIRTGRSSPASALSGTTRSAQSRTPESLAARHRPPSHIDPGQAALMHGAACPDAFLHSDPNKDALFRAAREADRGCIRGSLRELRQLCSTPRPDALQHGGRSFPRSFPAVPSLQHPRILTPRPCSSPQDDAPGRLHASAVKRKHTAWGARLSTKQVKISFLLIFIPVKNRFHLPRAFLFFLPFRHINRLLLRHAPCFFLFCASTLKMMDFSKNVHTAINHITLHKNCIFLFSFTLFSNCAASGMNKIDKKYRPC